MTNAPKNLATSIDGFARNAKLGEFFRQQRMAAGVSEETVVQALELEAVETVRGYESGAISIPLEDIFALTNLLNVSPEAVMDLVHSLLMHGDH